MERKMIMLLWTTQTLPLHPLNQQDLCICGCLIPTRELYSLLDHHTCYQRSRFIYCPRLYWRCSKHPDGCFIVEMVYMEGLKCWCMTWQYQHCYWLWDMLEFDRTTQSSAQSSMEELKAQLTYARSDKHKMIRCPGNFRHARIVCSGEGPRCFWPFTRC